MILFNTINKQNLKIKYNYQIIFKINKLYFMMVNNYLNKDLLYKILIQIHFIKYTVKNISIEYNIFQIKILSLKI